MITTNHKIRTVNKTSVGSRTTCMHEGGYFFSCNIEGRAWRSDFLEAHESPMCRLNPGPSRGTGMKLGDFLWEENG